MTLLQVLILAEWVLILIGLAAFQVRLGNPKKSLDPVVGWHLQLMSAAQELEIVALFMAGLSLFPSVAAYAVSAGIVYWRLWLLAKTRRQGLR